jgi:very-short-patch-repair endonuclease
MTPYQALSIQIAAAASGFTPDARLVEEAAHWTGKDFAAKARLIERLADLTGTFGPLNQHIYFGVRRIALQPADFQRQIPRLRALASKASALAAYASMIANYIGVVPDLSLLGVKTLAAILTSVASLPPGSENIAAAIALSPSPRRIAKAAALGIEWQQHQAPYLQIFHPAAWTAPVARLRAAIAKGAAFWPARAGEAYREAGRSLASLLSVPLPDRAADRLMLIDVLLASQTLRARLAAEAGLLSNLFGDGWHEKKTVFRLIHDVARTVGDLTSFDPRLNIERVLGIARDGSAAAHGDHLEADLDEVAKLLAEVMKFLDLDAAAIFQTNSAAAINLNKVSERAAKWAANPGRFEEWARLAAADREARASGPARIASTLASGRLEPKNAILEIETAFAEACWKKAIAGDPELSSFDGDSHAALVGRFRELEEKSREAAVRSVRAKHRSAIPRGAQGAMGVVRAEIGRKRGHMPLRRLMKIAGNTIQKIKPVFLMSPVTVAQFLPPGSVDFDLLVIDEASQVRPEDALGLIARCRRIVVVGDKKQLPPTNFFDRMIADDASPSDNSDAAIRNPDGTAPITDLESILSLCEARGLESQMLRWHYRSRHPSLIEVSNAEFYHRLVMPPAPVTERGEQGLKLRRVVGAYDLGGKRTNEIEAHAVAEAVARHARNDSGLSLGVVTFSTAQRDLIADILEAKRRDDSLLDAFLSPGGSEDLFIKNLENVQGDERDVILISIGYGPREAGQPLDSMAFGPVSAEGGERRLNVLFTRARVRCEVFVSFAPAGINLERASGEGPRVLKRFLQYAASGILKECRETGADFDSPFEAAVAEAIESIGYEVEPQVGSAGFKIDLAVRDPARPGRYMLAIECDRATYHSALWARERDRLRQQVLENLGWRFHRIWSTDWFYRRSEQLEKLRQILDAARAESAKDLQSPLTSQLAADHQEQVDPCTVELRHAAYELATCDRLKDLDEDGDGTGALGRAIRSVIIKEGPIHRDEIIRRIGHFLGKQRPNPRIAAAVAHALELLPDAAPDVCHESGFWFTQEYKNQPIVRDRSAAPASLRRIAMISTTEISAAISIARQHKSSLGDAEILSAVASLLGLPKPSAELRALVRSLAT